MKKVLAIALAMAMLSIMAVSGTLSYFTSTDGQANIMAVGNVQIEQLEMRRNGNSYEAFAPTKLYPYTGNGTPVDGWLKTEENAVDKIVTIKNTGSEDAFIRTLFAFEAVMDSQGNPTDPVGTTILVNYNTNTAVGEWKKLDVNPIEITKTVNGVEVTTSYYVYSFTYTNALAANASYASDPSLKQIALNGAAGNNFSGGSYDILVLSQAVQAQGFGDNVAAAFTAAFPITAEKLVEWFASIPTP